MTVVYIVLVTLELGQVPMEATKKPEPEPSVSLAVPKQLDFDIGDFVITPGSRAKFEAKMRDLNAKANKKVWDELVDDAIAGDKDAEKTIHVLLGCRPYSKAAALPPITTSSGAGAIVTECATKASECSACGSKDVKWSYTSGNGYCGKCREFKNDYDEYLKNQA